MNIIKTDREGFWRIIAEDHELEIVREALLNYSKEAKKVSMALSKMADKLCMDVARRNDV